MSSLDRAPEWDPMIGGSLPFREMAEVLREAADEIERLEWSFADNEHCNEITTDSVEMTIDDLVGQRIRQKRRGERKS